jgi:hypothetical protein
MITLDKSKAAGGAQDITVVAAAAYVTGKVYAAALKEPDPAAMLDDVCNVLPQVLPQVCKKTIAQRGAAFVEAMRAEVADRLWAFAAIEHTRTTVGDGYGYVFDLLAEQLRDGADPATVRTTALDVPRRIRQSAGGAA